MFQPIWNCLLAKPAIDLRYVPEFLRLFFSTNNKVSNIPLWIIRLYLGGGQGTNINNKCH